MTVDVREEIAKSGKIIEEMDPEALVDADPETVRETVEEYREEITSLESDQALSNVFGMAAMHPNPHLRHAMLDVAADRLDNAFCREYISSSTHDDIDFVAFEAILLCGEHELQEAIDDLVPIVGWPDEGPGDMTRLEWGGNPVGVGRASVVTAEFEIFGTEDPDTLAMLKDHYQENGRFPTEYHYNAALDHAGSDDADLDDPPDGMVPIPGGTYTVGVDPGDVPFDRFDDSYLEPQEVEVSPFYIDKYPVTNAEYDEFVESVDDHSVYGHPAEPEDKDRTRITAHEDLGPDHPVTGIDFYDAYAYANWAGKDLPFEEEWEIAARGPEGHIFPWGDEWDPDELHWAGNTFDAEIETIPEWTDLLTETLRDGPNETQTVPVDAHEEGASDFGVYDMLGNVWEYTKSGYMTRQEVNPVFDHPPGSSHENLIDEHEAFPVIRGGSWSNIPEQASAVFRGKDLLTDRHNEIGFRCVYRP